MTDRIVLQGISARGFHGVLDVEKVDGQDFVVDVALEVDLRRAGRSDLLAHTVNYAEVAADIVALITGPSLDLIETLADQIAAAALRRPLVQAVEVTVHKPQAPVGVPFGDVQVVVERRRDEPVVIALGANLGAVQATLEAAVRQLGPCRRTARQRRFGPVRDGPGGWSGTACLPQRRRPGADPAGRFRAADGAPRDRGGSRSRSRNPLGRENVSTLTSSSTAIPSWTPTLSAATLS